MHVRFACMRDKLNTNLIVAAMCNSMHVHASKHVSCMQEAKQRHRYSKRHEIACSMNAEEHRPRNISTECEKNEKLKHEQKKRKETGDEQPEHMNGPLHLKQHAF